MIYVLIATAAAATGTVFGFFLGVSAERDRLSDILVQDIVSEGTRQRNVRYGSRQ